MSLNNNNFSVDSIINDHINIVYSCARKLSLSIPPGYVDEEDLISEGMCALVKAAKEYDPSKQSTFAGYIRLKADGAMKDYLRQQDILPQKKRKQIKEFQKNLSSLEAKLGRTATESEILTSMSISKNDYIEIINNLNLSSTLYIDSYEYDFLDSFQEIDNSDSTQQLLLDIIIEGISTLSEREQLIFQLFFYEELSFKEIANILNISAPRISQIYRRALNQLRKFVYSKIE